MTAREATSQPGIFRYQTKIGTRYRVVVDAGHGEDGKRRQLTRSGLPTMAAAKKVRGDLLNEGRAVAAGSVTFAAFAVKWLAQVEPTVRQSTFVGYERFLRLYVLPRLGPLRLGEIGAIQVQGVQDAMLAAGRKPSTVRQARLVMLLVFKLAERWELVPRNPVTLVDAPAGSSGGSSGSVWTIDECRRFLVATAEERHGPLWALLLSSSMRIGEALALTWGAVDLKAGTVTIRQTLTRGRGGVYALGDPKTDNARRTIALGPVGVAALSRLPRGTAGAFVFPGVRVAWMHPETARAALILDCARAGVPRIRVHDLRHVAISLAIEAGVPMVVVSRRAGHASMSITADRYTHPPTTMDRDAAEVLGGMLMEGDARSFG